MSTAPDQPPAPDLGAVGAGAPVVAYHPLTIAIPGRPVELTMKVSAPVTGQDLPILLLSHGHGGSTFLSSLHGYSPLAEYWAAHGFAVIQPTHLDSGMLGLREADDVDAPLYTRSRAEDISHVIDRLDAIETAVPALHGRLDRTRIAVAGHSLGGHTACMVLGMSIQHPSEPDPLNLRDERIGAGVVMAAPGAGDLADWAASHYPVLRESDFSTMSAPALVVAGDRDLNPMFSDRLSYRWDAFTLSPAPKELLLVHGAEHMLGGVSGYDAAETSDEDPARVHRIRSLALAYLRSTLSPGDASWDEAVRALRSESQPSASVESR